MSELLAEVDEAIKRERLENIWKTYGNVIIGGIFLVILATGGYSAYSNWKIENDKKQTDLFLQAEDLNDPAKLAEAAKDLGGGLATIAKIRAAGSFLAQNDETQALALYTEVAADKNSPREFRDLAEFMKAKLSVKSAPDAALTALEAMSADTQNPYRFHAHLEAAIVFAHEKQDYASARKHVDAILAEKEIPPGLNTKANALSVLYALKEKK